MEGSVATGLGSLDFGPVITALTSAVTPAQIIALLASVIAFGIPFVFMWFGIRKVIKIFRSAVMGGSIVV
ncbi:MAG: hypothetical protein HFJ57_02335 [Clostridia bacterium]|nr:hypothetical protein [Clostridia bacterium]